jgi:hypothetical protein
MNEKNTATGPGVDEKRGVGEGRETQTLLHRLRLNHHLLFKERLCYSIGLWRGRECVF